MHRIPSCAKSLRVVTVAAIIALAAGAASALQMGSGFSPTQQVDQERFNLAAERDFIRSDYQADQFEITLDRLAIHQSTSPTIQAFARKTLQQQRALDENLYSTKQQLGLHNPKHPPRRYTRQLDHIRKLSGSAFDKAYLLALRHAFHNDKNTFQYQQETAKNPTLKPIIHQGLAFYTQRLAALHQLVAANH